MDYENPQVRKKLLSGAIKRASKWISLSLSEAKQMAGQVGGVSVHKKPLLTLQPDYVLKPLQTDHRGIREVAFYEAIEVASRNSLHAYSLFLTSGMPEESPSTSTVDTCCRHLDTWAVALSFLWKDPVVMASEADMNSAWKQVKNEMDALTRLTKFLAPYYGIVGQRKVLSDRPYGISNDAHLLLQDVTKNFCKPCVMDLKMGTQSYEPDASNAKRLREIQKYPQQKEFGFRIIGMRYYEPSDKVRSDENGYVFVGKEYGRSLSTRDMVKEAFRTYLSAGMVSDATKNEEVPCTPDENDGMSKDQSAQVDATVYTDEKTTDGAPEGSTDLEPIRKSLRIKSVSSLLLQVRSLKRWLEENESRLCFYASSLLIVFEGSVTNSDDQGIASLRLIDFGRVRRRTEGETSAADGGYLKGVQTFHDLLTELLEEEKAFLANSP